MKYVLLIVLGFFALPVVAQTADTELKPKFQKAPEGVIYDNRYKEEVIEVERPESRTEQRPFAMLRGLDKISGRVKDVKVEVGEVVTYERLTILVDECREPPEDEASDAFVLLTISDKANEGGVVFSGWMFASSPALSAMDHQRYDIWVLSCATS